MWEYKDGLAHWDGREIGPTDIITYADGEVLGEGEHTATLAPEPSGDAAFFHKKVGGNFTSFGFERKAVANLVASWYSGELADQMRRLTNYDWGALLIEGNLSAELDKWDIPWSTMMTVLLDYQDLGIRVIFTPNIEASKSYIQHLHRKYGREASEPLRTMKRAGCEGMESLTWVPGVGPKTAMDLLGKLDTPGDVVMKALDRTLERYTTPRIARLIREAYWYD